MPANIDLGHSWQCSLHESFLYNGNILKDRWMKATVLGASSYSGHSMTFHVLIEDTGGVFSYIPIHALARRSVSSGSLKPTSTYSYRELDYHFCPDDHFTSISFGHLNKKKLVAWIKDKNNKLQKHKASYMMTFDWPDGNILQHLIELETGQYALVPNHKMIVSERAGSELPDYKKMRTDWV